MERERGREQGWSGTYGRDRQDGGDGSSAGRDEGREDERFSGGPGDPEYPHGPNRDRGSQSYGGRDLGSSSGPGRSSGSERGYGQRGDVFGGSTSGGSMQSGTGTSIGGWGESGGGNEWSGSSGQYGHEGWSGRHSGYGGGYGGRYGDTGHSYGRGNQVDRPGTSGGARSFGKPPKGYQRSDQRLTEEVCDRLMETDWIDASEVSVRVDGGEVTLTGTVPSRDMKHTIEDIASSVMGVRDVINNVRVDRSRSGGGAAHGGGAQGSGDEGVAREAESSGSETGGSSSTGTTRSSAARHDKSHEKG